MHRYGLGASFTRNVSARGPREAILCFQQHVCGSFFSLSRSLFRCDFEPPQTDNFAFSIDIKEGVIIHFVDYAGMGSDPLFKEFGQALHTANITGFTKEQHYAFYMNAYNYLAAKTVASRSHEASILRFEEFKFDLINLLCADR